MENDKGMKSKDVRKLAVRLVDEIRDACAKGREKQPNSPPETETMKD